MPRDRCLGRRCTPRGAGAGRPAFHSATGPIPKIPYLWREAPLGISRTRATRHPSPPILRQVEARHHREGHREAGLSLYLPVPGFRPSAQPEGPYLNDEHYRYSKLVISSWGGVPVFALHRSGRSGPSHPMRPPGPGSPGRARSRAEPHPPPRCPAAIVPVRFARATPASAGQWGASPRSTPGAPTRAELRS